MENEERVSPFLLILDGQSVLFSEAECYRDLANISGTFSANLAIEVPYAQSPTNLKGKRVEIFIEKTRVLSGWVEAVRSSGSENSVSVTIAGRDVTGDLADCAVNPLGPLEWRKTKLETFAASLIKPFGIYLQNQVDTGDAFELIGLNSSDTVLGAIEAQSRQRGVLVTSDGIGGLLLTKSGAERAKDSLIYPRGNVQKVDFSDRECFSDYYVKGQMHNLERPAQAALDPSLKPGQTNFQEGSKTPKQSELSASCRFGHAKDDSVKRYRPVVFMSKTQSGGSQQLQNISNPKTPKNKRTPEDVWSLNDQAAWRMRTNRAHGVSLTYVVPGFLNNDGELWKLNQIVHVLDILHNIDGDMLISAVKWSYSNHEFKTSLSVVPLDAFDLTGDMDGIPKSGQRRLASGRRS